MSTAALRGGSLAGRRVPTVASTGAGRKLGAVLWAWWSPLACRKEITPEAPLTGRQSRRGARCESITGACGSLPPKAAHHHGGRATRWAGSSRGLRKGSGMRTRQETLDTALDKVRLGQRAVGDIVLESDGRIEALARVADEALVSIAGGLIELGATDEQVRTSQAYSLELPLNAISPPALLPLEEALTAACAHADAVDAARRRVGTDGIGQDLGEMVRQVLARVSLERVGAVGKGLE